MNQDNNAGGIILHAASKVIVRRQNALATTEIKAAVSMLQAQSGGAANLVTESLP
jgi:hypothetical protein